MKTHACVCVRVYTPTHKHTRKKESLPVLEKFLFSFSCYNGELESRSRVRGLWLESICLFLLEVIIAKLNVHDYINILKIIGRCFCELGTKCAFELLILLLGLPPECWDYGCAPPYHKAGYSLISPFNGIIKKILYQNILPFLTSVLPDSCTSQLFPGPDPKSVTFALMLWPHSAAFPLYVTFLPHGELSLPWCAC